MPARFTLGRGTALTEDGTQIVATVDGNLSYSKGCFNVDETLLINGDVSNATGNIDFIGNVIIKGNIFEGFRVASKKDITINGTATKAELNAGGNIHVKIGCINCNIQCKGNARIGFCENSKIHCEGNLESSSFIGGEAFAGKSINVIGKGKIVGGKYTALENIEASTIGNENYIKTYITLGNNAVLSEEREYDQRHIEELEDKFEQLGKIMTTLAEMARATKLPPEREQMKVEVMKSRFQIQGELRRLRVRMAEIDAALERKQNLSVSCQKAFYPGVTIRINSLVYNVNVMTPHCKAVIGDAEIELRPL